MPRASRRPRPVRIDDLGARVVRGPANGRWYWRIWRTRAGAEETVSTGWWNELEISRVLAGLVTTGVDTPRARNRVETVTDLLEFWIGEQEQRADLSAGTVRVCRAALPHLRDGIGSVMLDAVDRLVLERYRDRRLRAPVQVLRKVRVDGSPTGMWEQVDTGRKTAPRSLAFEIHVLRMAWRWGREVGIAPARELPRINVTVREHVRNRYTPSPAETGAVFRELEGWASLAILLYAGTGCRLDEIASLRWADVALGTEEMHVHGKTGRRTIPLSPPLVAALRAAQPDDPSGRVLSCSRATARAIYDRLKVACRLAGVPYFSPGGLRRAVVAALYRSGEDPSVAGAVVGHGPIVAMRHYRQVADDEKRDAMRRARLGYLPDPDGTVVEMPQRRTS